MCHTVVVVVHPSNQVGPAQLGANLDAQEVEDLNQLEAETEVVKSRPNLREIHCLSAQTKKARRNFSRIKGMYT